MRRMTKVSLFIGFMLLAVILGCKPGSTPTFVDAAKPITVKAGEKFAIELQSNRTTGYRWDIQQAPDPKVVTLVNSEYLPPTSNPAGAGSKEVWTFQLVTAGETKLTLKYWRSFEKDVPPIDSRTFSVTVR